MPISVIGKVDDTLNVCGALCNFKKPVYND